VYRGYQTVILPSAHTCMRARVCVFKYSAEPDPQLTDNDSWNALPVAVDPLSPPEKVRVVERGRVMIEDGVVEVLLECDYVAATALKLIVLASDAANNNAVVTEVAIWAV